MSNTQKYCQSYLQYVWERMSRVAKVLEGINGMFAASANKLAGEGLALRYIDVPRKWCMYMFGLQTYLQYFVCNRCLKQTVNEKFTVCFSK